MNYTPQLGASGLFKLLAPFDRLVTPDVIYTIRSIRTIGDILASGELVYESYYKPLGVTEASYRKDLAENVPMVGLQAGTGEYIYAPASFVATAPEVNGVRYTSVVLGVSLGAVPDDMSLEGLKGLIKNLVIGTIGIEPQIKGVMVSQPSLLPREYHDRLVVAREAKITMTQTDYSRAIALEDENVALRKKVQELEAYVLAKHVS